MNIKNQMPKPGKKGVLTGIVISFCAVIALVGVYTFNQYQENVEDNLDQLVASEEKEAKDASEEEIEQANTNEIINETPEVEILEEPAEETPEVILPELNHADTKPAVEFQVTDDLVWPVSGEVLMGYSMDKSVYFETLDQYKRNPAMIVSAEVGTQVVAAGRGIVQYVEEKTDTGLTVSLDMGNGFQAVYGQLGDVSVSEGDLLEAGDAIGMIAEPSMYYSLEGANLYFEFIQNGESIDPMDYLR